MVRAMIGQCAGGRREGSVSIVMAAPPDNRESKSHGDVESSPLLRPLSRCPARLQAVIGRLCLLPQEIMAIEPGQLRLVSDTIHRKVDLVCEGQLIARGELVNVDGALGVRVTSVRQDG